MLKKLTLREAVEFEELPNDIYNLIVNNSVVCFGEAIGDITISIAVFSNAVSFEHVVALRFIGTNEAYRKNGYAKQLLDFSKQELINLGAKGIYVKLNEDFATLYNNHAFLLSMKFIPVVLNGHSIEYDLSDIEKSPLFLQIIPNLEQFPATESIDEWNNSLLNHFLLMNRENGLFLTKDNHDSGLSRIYKRDGFIAAALFVARQEDGYIINQIFLEKGVKSQLVIPALLAGVIQDMLVDGRDGRLRLHIYQESYYSGILGLLGEPKKDNRIAEYYFQL